MSSFVAIDRRHVVQSTQLNYAHIEYKWKDGRFVSSRLLPLQYSEWTLLSLFEQGLVLRPMQGNKLRHKGDQAARLNDCHEAEGIGYNQQWGLLRMSC